MYTLDMMEYTATEDNRAVLVCVVCMSLVSEHPSATTVTVMLSTADGTAVGEWFIARVLRTPASGIQPSLPECNKEKINLCDIQTSDFQDDTLMLLYTLAKKLIQQACTVMNSP